MKPYFERGGIVIYHGDCRDVLPTVQADVLVTDPPYGISFASNKNGALKGQGITGDADTALRDTILRAWAPRPALVCGSWKRPTPEGTRQVLVWEKGDHVGMGDLSLPWRPNHEFIYVLGSGFVGHRGSAVLRAETVVSWASRGRVHPNQKPVGLFVKLLAKCPPGVVVDPFMGTGPTLAAAQALGRRAIGIEIEERYCEIAANRLAQQPMQFDAPEPKPLTQEMFT